MGQPRQAAKALQHFHTHLDRRGALSAHPQENRKELRIGEGISAMRQQPFTRTLGRRPMGNAMPNCLAAHVASP